jgi:hypothetical protein
MRKLVFGIIAVICVQFAFVNYMELQSPLDLAVAPVHTAPPAEANSDLGWIEELDRFALLPPEREASVPPTESERTHATPKDENPSIYRPVRLEARQPRQAPAEIRPEVYFPSATEGSAPESFETVVISYNRSPELSNCDKYDAPKTKRRSLMAKAIPAAKKPWEWMKSVGSKLY